MYRRGDPRWNRTIQHISENIEHANETAAENLYGFTQRYVNPCLSSLTNCCNAVTAPCFPSNEDLRRRNRARSRGRAELSFDFYDDWEEDENDGLLGWGNDNLERFLGTAANYGTTSQPSRQRAMSYGQRARDPRFDTSRRKSTAHAREVQDPTLIPSSSYFGFLGRLPFKLGGKGLRYKPSAADLTEHPGALRRSIEEEQPLIEDSEEDHPGSDYKTQIQQNTHRRARSNTHTSGHTTDSFSSRGDIFPSEDELDDAVPLDDEFTIALERRTTGGGQSGELDNHSHSHSGKNTRSNSTKRPSRSTSSRTVSSGKKSESTTDNTHPTITDLDLSSPTVPTLADLSLEEERARLDEESELDRRRQNAQHLAVQRGLVPPTPTSAPAPAPADPSTTRAAQMSTLHSSVSPLVRSPVSETPRTLTAEDGVCIVGPGTGEEVVGGAGGDRPGAQLEHELEHEMELDQERDQRGAAESQDERPAVTAVRSGDQGEEEFVPARLPRFG
ncbi:hypothetical protein E8E13_007258 [Curvularia kusanoi]|uniref:Uncharacterized protein n=1 Tax=Curvularia kusanoi TaxID=90978 RepID=A0A9P4THS2_CURKU|nr:hypothetical protein E8E13_007258 [Curvularia kusanoi]